MINQALRLKHESQDTKKKNNCVTPPLATLHNIRRAPHATGGVEVTAAAQHLLGAHMTHAIATGQVSCGTREVQHTTHETRQTTDETQYTNKRNGGRHTVVSDNHGWIQSTKEATSALVPTTYLNEPCRIQCRSSMLLCLEWGAAGRGPAFPAQTTIQLHNCCAFFAYYLTAGNILHIVHSLRRSHSRKRQPWLLRRSHGSSLRTETCSS